MPVIGIDQVPRNIVRPKWYEDYGYGQGKIVHDLLLAALTGQMGGGVGQIPPAPTPQNPGTFNFPPGSQSPGEAAQIRQMGGVPTNAGVLARSTQLPGTGGVSFTQPTRFGMRPDLDYQMRQTQLQKAQQDLDPNSISNQHLKAITDSLNQPKPQGGFDVQQIEDDAMAGDEDAVSAYRYLKRIGAF